MKSISYIFAGLLMTISNYSVAGFTLGIISMEDGDTIRARNVAVVAAFENFGEPLSDPARIIVAVETDSYVDEISLGCNNFQPGFGFIELHNLGLLSEWVCKPDTPKAMISTQLSLSNWPMIEDDRWVTVRVKIEHPRIVIENHRTVYYDPRK